MKDKSLFFLVMSLVCIWLVLDEFYGHNYISQFIVKLIPKAEDDGGFFNSSNSNQIILNGTESDTPDRTETVTDLGNWIGGNPPDGAIIQ